MEQLLKVGDLARETGKSVRAIHLYEEMGLIQSVARTTGRYRLFPESALERLTWISRLQTIGLSLSQIQERPIVWSLEIQDRSLALTDPGVDRCRPRLRSGAGRHVPAPLLL